MTFDQFYTPELLARRMIARVTAKSVRSVADFSAGDGALLSAAKAQWPSAIAIASDIDPASVARLRKGQPGWSVSRCDFLNDRSRASAIKLRDWKGEIDLILLNPPFSCRGASRTTINLHEETVSCSRAFAFLATALSYLSEDGELVALMPVNTLFSEKDAVGWNLLRKHFRVTKGEVSSRRDFAGCFVKCVILQLRRGQGARSRNRNITLGRESNRRPKVNLVRGTVQMHALASGSRTLVHSTDLFANMVTLNGHVASATRPSIVGPAVLVPRVGQPSHEKICVYLRRKRVALSDCVIGIQCRSSCDAILVHSRLLQARRKFLGTYSGTCAQYTTLKRIEKLLLSVGCAVERLGKN